MDEKTLEVVERFLKGKQFNVGVDLGCGYGEYSCILKRHVQFLIGVDRSVERLEYARKHGCYDMVVVSDIKNYYPSFDVDVAFMFDVIEHLPKKEGYILLDRWMRKAKMIVLTTPSKYFPFVPKNSHLSVWSDRELKQLGFETLKYRRDFFRTLIFGEHIFAWWHRKNKYRIL